MSVDTLESKNALLIAEGKVPAEIFSDKEVIDRLIEEIREKAKQHVPDVSTKRGRDEIASVAYKVARTKTALDEMGKGLVAEEKAKIARIDAERKRIRDSLDALKDEVRKPLDEWEVREKERIDNIKAKMEQIKTLANGINSLATGELVTKALYQIDGIYASTQWDEFQPHVDALLDAAKGWSNQRIEYLTKLEEQQAKAAEERARAEAELQAERARIEAERAKLAAERKAAEMAAAEERRQAEQKAAEERARIEAERAKLEAERNAVEMVAAEERRIAERKAAEERAKLEAERAVFEAERKAAQAQKEAPTPATAYVVEDDDDDDDDDDFDYSLASKLASDVYAVSRVIRDTAMAGALDREMITKFASQLEAFAAKLRNL